MGVTTLHPEYENNKPWVQLCRDAVVGLPAVKPKGTTYLPADFAKSDEARYAVYQERAYFIGATKQAKKSYMGMVFRKAPETGSDGLPNLIDDIQYNIDGCGQSIEQIAKLAIGELMETPRFGLLADYPNAQSGLTAEQESKLGLRPFLSAYPFESVINWKTSNVNGCEQLTLVVLREKIDNSESEFDHNFEYQYRVLRLVGGEYTQQLYNNGGSPIGEEFAPLMACGQSFDHIPFHFAGTDDNTPAIGQPLLLDLALMNISHYQSTANVEEAAYLLGCPTLHIDIGDMSADDFTSVNGAGIRVGARKGIQTQRGKIEMVQANESGLGADQMEKKIERMKELGAKLVTSSGQNETAETARINASGQSSALDLVVNNVSDCMEKALEDLQLFMGEAEQVTYRLNTNFWEETLDPQALSAITGLVGRSISNQDLIYMLQTGRVQLEEGRTAEQVAESIANDNSGLPID